VSDRRRRALLRTIALTALLFPALTFAFDLQGHRGTRGLAPENTLAAFRKALAIGVTTLETDLAVTRDGVLVIAHDRRLNVDIVRGPDGKWLAAAGPPIHTLTLEQLRTYDVGRVDPASKYAAQFPEQQPADGERFPTFAELIALATAAPKAVRLNVETKLDPAAPDETPDPATFARLVVAAIRAAGMADRITIQSFDWRTLREARRLAPEIATVCLTIETASNDNVKPTATGPSPWTAGLDLRDYGDSVPRLVQAAGCAVWSPFWRDATSARIAEAHALKLKVIPWTVNAPADIASMIERGADGVISDYPDRARKVMTDQGLPLP
jgi:glycerophosphoryl diester phosphodiesterase